MKQELYYDCSCDSNHRDSRCNNRVHSDRCENCNKRTYFNKCNCFSPHHPMDDVAKRFFDEILASPGMQLSKKKGIPCTCETCVKNNHYDYYKDKESV